MKIYALIGILMRPPRRCITFGYLFTCRRIGRSCQRLALCRFGAAGHRGTSGRDGRRTANLWVGRSR